MVRTVGPDMLFRMLQDKTAKYITNHKRDWIHVKDVARAICYLMSSTYTGHIDVGTGEATTTVKELAEAFGQANLPVKDTYTSAKEMSHVLTLLPCVNSVGFLEKKF